MLVEQANQESNGDTMAGFGATRFSSSTTVSRALGIIIRVDYYDLAMAKGMNGWNPGTSRVHTFITLAVGSSEGKGMERMNA